MLRTCKVRTYSACAVIRKHRPSTSDSDVGSIPTTRTSFEVGLVLLGDGVTFTSLVNSLNTDKALSGMNGMTLRLRPPQCGFDVDEDVRKEGFHQ